MFVVEAKHHGEIGEEAIQNLERPLSGRSKLIGSLLADLIQFVEVFAEVQAMGKSGAPRAILLALTRASSIIVCVRNERLLLECWSPVPVLKHQTQR